MPEELVIVLVIVIAAIWLSVKIVQGIAASIDQATKNYNAAVAKRKQIRYSRGREKLRQYIYTLIPNELDDFEKKLERVRIEFEEVQRETSWVARPPAWTEEKFQRSARPLKRSGYREMCVDEICAILTPDSDASTWLYEESEIIRRICKYPTASPASNPENFILFPILSADLKQAVFQIDESHISKKNVERYFADDQIKALTYNSRRADLVTKTNAFNSTIEEWNRTNRTSWEVYVSKSEQMGNTALLDYQRAADLYVKACREEVTYFKRLRDGYKKGEKQCVIERLGFIFDRIGLPGSVPHTWDIDFEEEQQIAVIDVGLPDVVHQLPYKTVTLQSGVAKKPLNQTEKKELVPKVHPAILLRAAYEIFRSDANETIKLLVLNGWVKFDDPATGVKTKAYTASLSNG